MSFFLLSFSVGRVVSPARHAFRTPRPEWKVRCFVCLPLRRSGSSRIPCWFRNLRLLDFLFFALLVLLIPGPTLLFSFVGSYGKQNFDAIGQLPCLGKTEAFAAEAALLFASGGIHILNT